MRLKDHFYVEIDEDGNEVLVTETYVDYGESDTPILDKFKGEISIDAIADYCNQKAYSQEEREYALEVIMSSDFQEICNSIFDSAKNKKVKGVYKDILFE